MGLKFMVLCFPTKCVSKENTCMVRFIVTEIIFFFYFILNRTLAPIFFLQYPLNISTLIFSTKSELSIKER